MKRALVIVLLLAAACTSTGTKVTLKAAKPAAHTGGTIVVGIRAPVSIDPANADLNDAAGNLVISTMCDRLIQLDPVTGAPKPALAESWQVSDDGTRFTIRLRKGVRFSNGRELTSDDVVSSLSRVASRETASPVATLLRPIKGYETVHGEQEASDERFRTTLSGVRTIETYSFEMTIKAPDAGFIRLLSHPLASITPRASTQSGGASFGRKPVCAGPYQLTEPWTPSQPVIKLTRNAAYAAKNVGFTRGGAGYADAIEFHVYPDLDSILRDYKAGRLDVAHVPQNAAADPSVQADLVSATTPTIEYIGLPVRTPPFDNRAVRVALSQALDRRALIAAAYAGHRQPATGFLPPALGADHRASACGRSAPEAGDVAAARATLRGAGVDPASTPGAIEFDDQPDHRALVTAIAQQWQAAFGFSPSPAAYPWTAYISQGQQQPGFSAPFRLGWAGEYLSPDRYLVPLFGSASLGQTNLTRFANRDFDHTLEHDARKATVDADRRTFYQHLEDTICEQMPAIPIAYGARQLLFRRARIDSAVSAFADITDGEPLLRELYVR